MRRGRCYWGTGDKVGLLLLGHRGQGGVVVIGALGTRWGCCYCVVSLGLQGEAGAAADALRAAVARLTEGPSRQQQQHQHQQQLQQQQQQQQQECSGGGGCWWLPADAALLAAGRF